jgi:hypothetical protein
VALMILVLLLSVPRNAKYDVRPLITFSSQRVPRLRIFLVTRLQVHTVDLLASHNRIISRAGEVVRGESGERASDEGACHSSISSDIRMIFFLC